MYSDINFAAHVIEVSLFPITSPLSIDLPLNCSGQVDTQLQITGSIMQPNISGKIKLSRGEAYLPHDKGGGAAQINRDVSNQSNFPSGYNQVVASKYVSRFLNLKPAASSAPFNQLSGKLMHEKN